MFACVVQNKIVPKERILLAQKPKQVEMAGIEPASERLDPRKSTSVAV